MKLLALHAAQEAVWQLYSKRAQNNDNSRECQKLGQESEWLFLVWRYNTLSDEQRQGIPAECHRHFDHY